MCVVVNVGLAGVLTVDVFVSLVRVRQRRMVVFMRMLRYEVLHGPAYSVLTVMRDVRMLMIV
jgi:hypothetical protein